jgi:GntR family transcriptional regulator/MocR family aminotransferase
MKCLYAARRAALLRCLQEATSDSIKVQANAGLAVVTLLPEHVSDVDIALRSVEFGLAPAPLSPWYMQSAPQQGLLLGVTNLSERRLAADCRRLAELARVGTTAKVRLGFEQGVPGANRRRIGKKVSDT